MNSVLLSIALAADGFVGDQTGGGRTEMGQLLNQIGTVFESFMDWAAEVGSVVVSNPLLLLGVITPVACIGVGLFKRLIRL